jgi:hypothetical protein
MVRICFFKPNFVAGPFRGEFYRREMEQMKLRLPSYAKLYYAEIGIKAGADVISPLLIAPSLNVKE